MESPVLNEINGHDPKVKVEDAMDEGQLNRLVTGFTVDATGSSNTAVSSFNFRRIACVHKVG
jgi:hypothetical protein